MQSRKRHLRTQQLLLISKLLDGRDSSSPFTLVVDSLEQSALPLVQQFVTRSKSHGIVTIYVSFETLEPPTGLEESNVIRADELDLPALVRKVEIACRSSEKKLVVLDTLHPLLSAAEIPNPAHVLGSLISPTTSVLAVYHASQPLFNALSHSHAPHPLTLCRHIATTILVTHSFFHIKANKVARDKSRAQPLKGVDESEEGVLQGAGANELSKIAVECEFRRRSGRTVDLWFVLDTGGAGNSLPRPREPFPGITLLEEHPEYQIPIIAEGLEKPTRDESEHGEVSFNLSLTERQRREREGVVLPYLDAQSSDGIGQGGRIIYDMGTEDDFDDEEDEI